MFHLLPYFSVSGCSVLIIESLISACVAEAARYLSVWPVDTSSMTVRSLWRAPDTIWLSLSPAILAPFCRGIKKSLFLSIFPRGEDVIQKSLWGLWRPVLGPHVAEAVILRRSRLSRSAFHSRLRFIRLFFKWWAVFLSHHVHVVYLSRCSPGDSRYLQHPPIICFTSFPTPPSPMLASPLILNLDHPSAAQRCTGTLLNGHV